MELTPKKIKHLKRKRNVFFSKICLNRCRKRKTRRKMRKKEGEKKKIVKKQELIRNDKK